VKQRWLVPLKKHYRSIRPANWLVEGKNSFQLNKIFEVKLWKAQIGICLWPRWVYSEVELISAYEDTFWKQLTSQLTRRGQKQLTKYLKRNCADFANSNSPATAVGLQWSRDNQCLWRRILDAADLPNDLRGENSIKLNQIFKAKLWKSPNSNPPATTVGLQWRGGDQCLWIHISDAADLPIAPWKAKTASKCTKYLKRNCADFADSNSHGFFFSLSRQTKTCFFF
jgi:hypothetical protein